MGIRLVYSSITREYLKLPDEVSKVASLNPFVSEVIIELGLGSKLVSVSPLCKVLARSWGYGGVTDKPVIGDYVSINPRLARLVDLVILTNDVSERVLSTLRSLGTPYYLVSPPKTVWGISDFIIDVAVAMNELSRGIELARKFTRELSTLCEYVRKSLPLELLNSLAYVELDLGTTVIPGVFTHIITGLELVGIKTVNSRVYDSYVLGDKAIQLSKNLVSNADYVIYGSGRYVPSPNDVTRKLLMRLTYDVPNNVIVTKPLTLADYGPKFVETLRYVTKHMTKLNL